MIRQLARLMLIAVLLAAPAAAAVNTQSVYYRHLPQPPSHLTLCGEPVPMDNPEVAELLDREFQISVHEPAQVVMWLKRAQRYFPYISKRLKEAGMPQDIKYLAVAESALLTRVRSPMGAVGPWQFMPFTARRYGLRVNRDFDDRRNLEKATTAAIAYLKNLHEEFGSWALAMAAYNCGESRLREEIKEQGEHYYYDLHLPTETQRYIFRILAAKIIISDPERYGYHLDPERRYKPRESEMVSFRLRHATHLRELAKGAGTTYHQMKLLNPEIRGRSLPKGEHTLLVPKGQARALRQAVGEINGRVPPSSSYTVRRGDTLTAIAQSTGSSVAAIKAANGLRGQTIYVGQKLTIPGKE